MTLEAMYEAAEKALAIFFDGPNYAMTNWTKHLAVKHDRHGHCSETDRCPQEGFVLTLDGPRLADDPTRAAAVFLPNRSNSHQR